MAARTRKVSDSERSVLRWNTICGNRRKGCWKSKKSTMSVEGLREQLGLIVGRLEKLLTFRLALAHGLIRITGRPVKFYFEEYEKR